MTEKSGKDHQLFGGPQLALPHAHHCQFNHRITSCVPRCDNFGLLSQEPRKEVFQGTPQDRSQMAKKIP